MKYTFLPLFAILIIGSYTVLGQGVSINIAGTPPDPSAMIDISSTIRGTLITRMTTAQRDSIVSPAKGLQIYNTDCDNFNYNAGTPASPNWVSANPPIDLPAAAGIISGTAIVCQGQNNVSYSVPAITNATSYTWSYSGAGATFSGSTNPVTVSFSGAATSGNLSVIGSNVCGNGAVSANYVITVSPIPTPPIASANSAAQTQIVWYWNATPGATGYKYNTVNNYSSATDNGADTNYTQTGLSCNTPDTLYVWSYNSCGNSSATTLTQTTSSCWTCGDPLVINHTIDGVSPVIETITYGTVLTSLSGASKCWITQNLGASTQASSATDASTSAAGWYFQFNRKQGYVGGPPNLSSINENSDWVAANDPCTIELGTGWRIPTVAEWTNVISSGGSSWTGTSGNVAAYNSVLKLHAGGWIWPNDNSVHSLGSEASWWGSTPQYSDTEGQYLYFGPYSSPAESVVIAQYTKTFGYSIMCIKD